MSRKTRIRLLDTCGQKDFVKHLDLMESTMSIADAASELHLREPHLRLSSCRTKIHAGRTLVRSGQSPAAVAFVADSTRTDPRAIALARALLSYDNHTDQLIASIR